MALEKQYFWTKIPLSGRQSEGKERIDDISSFVRGKIREKKKEKRKERKERKREEKGGGGEKPRE